MRPYRKSLQNGQTSPLQHVVDFVSIYIERIREIKGLPISVLDVGCGSGELMKVVKARLGPDVIEYTAGIDYSPAAIEILEKQNIYDQLFCGSAIDLPIHSREFDVAVCVECLEHLYADQVVKGISELLRSAHYVVITTPTPETVINYHWLNVEIRQAIADKDPIGYQEYLALEGAVHKSILAPWSMEAAGFTRVPPKDAQFYFGTTSKIAIPLIGFKGINTPELPADLTQHDFRPDYVRLLQSSLQLGVELSKTAAESQ